MPNLAAIVQEVVNRSGWSSGNAMTIIITGTGHRTAYAYEGASSRAATLVVTYSTGCTTPTPTSASSIPVSGVELLSPPWHLVGNNGAAEAYQSINPNVLQGKNMLRITYDLHRLNALGGDASAIIFDQNGWRYISLSNYGQNGRNGVQVVDIPLSHFSGLDISQPVGMLHTRFWYGSPFAVDITSIIAY
jgi:hypothetical protein